MVYFWNDKQLARDLATNVLTEKQKLSYLIATLVFAGLMALIGSGLTGLAQTLHAHNAEAAPATVSPDLHFAPPADNDSASAPRVAQASPAAPAAAAPHGTALAYANPLFRVAIYIYLILVICLFFRTNQKGDGKNMLERYICLCFPVLIRTVSIVFLFSVGYGFIIGLLSHALDAGLKVQLLGLTGPLVIILMAVYYYLRMQMLFKIASGQSAI